MPVGDAAPASCRSPPSGMRWAEYSFSVAALDQRGDRRVRLAARRCSSSGRTLRRGQLRQAEHHPDGDGVAVGVEEPAAGDAAGAADDLDVDALVRRAAPKRSSMTSRGSASISFTPSVKCSASGRAGSSPASLARNELTPSQAMTTPARSARRRGGRCARPTTRPAVASRPVAVVERHQRGARGLGVPGEPARRSRGGRAVTPLYGGRPHAVGAVVDGQRLLVGHHHRRAAGDPPLHRDLAPTSSGTRSSRTRP